MSAHAFIRAHASRQHGWARLQFGFNKETSNLVKSLPGAKWGPFQGVPAPWTTTPALHKSWFVPIHSWSVLEKLVPSSTRWEPDRTAPIPDVIGERLRPYQLGDASSMTLYRAFFLLYDMRVGKTPTSIAAATALVAAGHADIILILYPAQVGLEWERQLATWVNAPLHRLEGKKTIDDSEAMRLAATPYLFLGCHYEILTEQEESIARILHGKRVVVISDECQALQNRKAPRGKSAIRLSRGKSWMIRGDVAEESVSADFTIVAWYALSGTPMRNKPKNLWLPFELALPGSMGGDFTLNNRGEIQGYSNYSKRYCDGKEGTYGWEDKGVKNPEELRDRLASVSVRRTRTEVAAHLPPSERQIIFCEAPASAMERYAKIESKHARDIEKIIQREGEVSGSARIVLEALARETSNIKIPKAVERVEYHLERGAKIVVFGHFKDTVKAMSEAAQKALGDSAPLYDAGTWQNLDPDDRKLIIEKWSAHEGPAILCANSLASGVGLDMSKAEVLLHLELEWVPADLRQREARGDDIHKGNRLAPLVHEYLLLRGTIDEPMAATLLDKISALEAIVGKDSETRGLGAALKESGLVNPNSLGLDSSDKEAVGAAMEHLRARLLSGAMGKASRGDAIAEVADLESDDGTSDGD